MVSCCCKSNEDTTKQQQQQDDIISTPNSNSEERKHQHNKHPPPSNSPHYPPYITPNIGPNHEEISFYLPPPEKRGEKEIDLACTLIRRKSSKAQEQQHHHHDNNPSKIPIDTQRPIIIICHGFASWRNQMLLSQMAASLSQELDCHTLRFDFGGNGHSIDAYDGMEGDDDTEPGVLIRSTGRYDQEYSDLCRVMNLVQKDWKCHVGCMMGHSKGWVSVMRWALEQEGVIGDDGWSRVMKKDGEEEEKKVEEEDCFVPCFVNLAGVFYDPSEFDRKTLYTQDQNRKLDTIGKFTDTIPIANLTYEVTLEDVEQRSCIDSRLVRYLKKSFVLIIFGGKDEVVSVGHARKYDDAFDDDQNHDLLIVEDGHHNFDGLKYIKLLSGKIGDVFRRHVVMEG